MLKSTTNLHEHLGMTQHHDQCHEGSPAQSATDAVWQTNQANNLHISSRRSMHGSSNSMAFSTALRHSMSCLTDGTVLLLANSRYTGLDFLKLCRNWFSQFDFHFSHQSSITLRPTLTFQRLIIVYLSTNIMEIHP